MVHVTAALNDAATSEIVDLGVWAELIGQTAAVATLQRAVAAEPHAMSHAWLFTGPPGSGRSNAARAFAAANEAGHCAGDLQGPHEDA